MTSVCEESIIGLIKKLIEHSLYETKPNLVAPTGRNSKPLTNKAFKSILNILFANQHRECSHEQKLSELEQLMWMNYKLSQRRQFDKAHQLSLCIDKLQFNYNLKEQSDLPSILQVLIALSKTPKDESLALFKPWIIAEKNDKWNLPNIPLNYGDTRLHTSSTNWFYTHYPPHLFEDYNLSKTVSGYMERKIFSRCNLYPGSMQEKSSRNRSVKRCLGAMLNPFCLPNPGTVLSIPELPDRKEGLEVASVFRSCLPSSGDPCQEQETDEGYASSHCSANGDGSDTAELHASSQVVENVEPPVKAVRKYVTEASVEIVKRLWIRNHYNWNILNDHPSPPIWHEKGEKELIKDILHLIVGVDSNSFTWLEDEDTFELTEGICCNGITPGAIRSHVEEFIVCGNKLRRLEQICGAFSHQPKGLVWNALVGSIKSFIVVYRAKALSYAGGLLAMKTIFSGLISKLYFLAATCDHLMQTAACTSQCGLRIINFLLLQMRTASSRANSYLLLSILQSCCRPFFQFLEKWIYCGQNYDPRGEFFVQSDPATLLFKDNRYWRDGHCLLPSQIECCEPSIRATMEGAFDCGKAISFLAAFAPNHSVVSEARQNHPKINFGWSSQLVQDATEDCERFSTKVKLTSESRNEMLLGQYDEICKARDISLINSATEQRIQTLKTINEMVNGRKEIVRNEKKQVMDGLVRNMNEARQHKTAQELAHKMMDDKIMAEREIRENVAQENANTIRNEMMKNYQEYLAESDQKELLLRQRLEMLQLNLNSPEGEISADAKSRQGAVAAAPVDPIRPIRSPSSQCSSTEPPLSARVNENPADPDSLTPFSVLSPDTPLDEFSAMSITSDAPSPVRSIDTRTECEFASTETTDSANNMDAENNRRNMMNSNLLTVAPDRSLSREIIPDTISHYVDQDGRNRNEVRANNLLQRPPTTETTDTGDHNVTTGHAPTYAAGIVPQTPQDNTTIVSDSADHARGMSGTTSVDSLAADCLPATAASGAMKKSKSDTFFGRRTTPLADGRRPKSCLFETSNLDDMPVLRDQDQISWPFENRLQERFSDTDLLSARNLDPITKPTAYTAPRDFKLCDRLPELNPLLKSDNTSLINETSDDDISTSVNYITRTISLHVAAQSKLVNEAILSHLLIDQGLLKDFNTLQSVMLTQDASISRSLVISLTNKLTPCCNPASILTPNLLNGVLCEALNTSILGPQLSERMFFTITNVPMAFQSPCDIWDCIELQYKVHWPNSVIIDRHAMESYVKIWKFLMKIHHTVYAMDDLFRTFLRQTYRLRVPANEQVHHLSVLSYEMNNFVRVILSYLSHQAVQTSLTSFEKSLRQGNVTVDQLREGHAEFLNVVMAKCFLNENGALVQNLLTDIFARVHKFCALLNTFSRPDGASSTGVFAAATKLSGDFHKMSLFMTKLLQKVSVYTRVDHIEAFDLQLNFNRNYKT